jgi:hypothetical protein
MSRHCLRTGRDGLAAHRGAASQLRRMMRRKIEYLFEVVEANAGSAVVSVAVSFALTGCLRFLWE